MCIRVNIGVFSFGWRLPAGRTIADVRVTRSIYLVSQPATKVFNRAEQSDSNLVDFYSQCLFAITSSGHLEKQTYKNEHFEFRFDCFVQLVDVKILCFLLQNG